MFDLIKSSVESMCEDMRMRGIIQEDQTVVIINDSGKTTILLGGEYEAIKKH